jgi:hypothetical protein
LSPIAPVYPSPPNLHPFWVFPGPNVLLIRTHPSPFPRERNNCEAIQNKMLTKSILMLFFMRSPVFVWHLFRIISKRLNAGGVLYP